VGGLHIVRKDAWIPDDLQAKMATWEPKSNLGQIVRDCLQYLPREQAAELFDRVCSCVVVETKLSIVALRSRDSRFWAGHHREDYGQVGHKVVTTAGVTYLAADIAGGASDSNLFKFHGLGTGSTAEAIGDTALVTELTTEYTGNVRATGSQSSTAGAYTTVGTNTLDSGTPALREHGILTQAATGGGTLLDRTVFASITLDGAAGDGLATTYVFTLATGG
jgi:hypothetical protein